MKGKPINGILQERKFILIESCFWSNVDDICISTDKLLIAAVKEVKWSGRKLAANTRQTRTEVR